jgi:nucleoside-diphosphate-sugar epimerase
MVIGNGLMARSFIQYEALDEFLIFASGVSHSKTCSVADCMRERELFISAVNAYPTKTIVYFSTSSVNDPDLQETPYVKHKTDMEALVKKMAARYHIFRLSNVVGASSNPSTLLNFFYNSIHEGRPFDLWKYSERNIIDVADVYRIADHILQHRLFINGIVNIANPKNHAVVDIIRELERFMGKKAVYTEKEKGSGFTIDITSILPIYQSLGIRFGDDYLPQILAKYYPST